MTQRHPLPMDYRIAIGDALRAEFPAGESAILLRAQRAVYRAMEQAEAEHDRGAAL